jgi:hypothetical protein
MAANRRRKGVEESSSRGGDEAAAVERRWAEEGKEDIDGLLVRRLSFFIGEEEVIFDGQWTDNEMATRVNLEHDDMMI